MMVNAEIRNFKSGLEKHCFVLKMRDEGDWCLLDSANAVPKYTKPGPEEVEFDERKFFAKCTMMQVYILEEDKVEDFAEVFEIVKRKMLGQ